MLTLRRPDDFHVHFRDGAMLAAVAPHHAWAGRVLVMPNLVPPLTTPAAIVAYRDRILAAGIRHPLMTLYLTEDTRPEDIDPEVITAVKLYPAGATTNSASGVRDWRRCQPVLERMSELGVPLCCHGEVTHGDIFDREALFLDEVLTPLRDAVPGLKIVLEHVTTAEGLAWVRAAGAHGSITAHHLMVERTDLLAGGIRPHLYCLPVPKRAEHRDALRAAATSGDPHFFFGSDSAPHPDGAKLAPCGCAGCFTAPVALPCLAQVFEEEGALDRLEAFASRNGATAYGLAPNPDSVTLVREPPDLPEVGVAGDRVTTFNPGLQWRLA